MKKIILMAVLVMGTAAAAHAVETVNVKVKGLVCSFCAQGLSKAFKMEPGVDDVKVSLKDKLLSLKLKPGATQDDKAITKFVTDSGYNVESIQREGK